MFTKPVKYTFNRIITSSIIIASLFIALTSCASMRATPSVHLSAPEQLSEYDDDPQLLTYKNKETNWDNYKRVIIEPVIWTSFPSEEMDINTEEVVELTSYFNNSLNKKLQQEFIVTDNNSNDTIRVKAVISEIEPTNTFLNVVSTLILFWPIDTGSTHVEIEIFDSITNERIGAMVFARNGSLGEFIKGYSRFGRTKHSLDTYAADIVNFLITNNITATSSL